MKSLFHHRRGRGSPAALPPQLCRRSGRCLPAGWPRLLRLGGRGGDGMGPSAPWSCSGPQRARGRAPVAAGLSLAFLRCRRAAATCARRWVGGPAPSCGGRAAEPAPRCPAEAPRPSPTGGAGTSAPAGACGAERRQCPRGCSWMGSALRRGNHAPILPRTRIESHCSEISISTTSPLAER